MDLSVRDILDRLEPIIAFGRQVFLETGDRHVADLNAEIVDYRNDLLAFEAQGIVEAIRS